MASEYFRGLLRTGQESGRGAGSGDLHPAPRPSARAVAPRHGLHGLVLRCARRGIRAPTATGASVSNGPDQLACTPGSLGVAVWQPEYTGRAREIPRRPAPQRPRAPASRRRRARRPRSARCTDADGSSGCFNFGARIFFSPLWKKVSLPRLKRERLIRQCMPTSKRDDEGRGVLFFHNEREGRGFLLLEVTLVYAPRNLCPAKRGATRMGARPYVGPGTGAGAVGRRNH